MDPYLQYLFIHRTKGTNRTSSAWINSAQILKCKVARWSKGLSSTTVQRQGFNPQRWSFQPHQTQLLSFTGEACVAAPATCSGWSVCTLCVCLHAPRQERWQFAATGTAVQTEETAPHRGAKMTMQKRGNKLSDAQLFTGSKSNAPVQQVTAAATLLGWTLLCLFLTVWHFDHILTCFKGLLPFHVWSPQVLCCFMTPSVQRRRLRHPHIYRLIKHPLRSAFMCSDISLSPAQCWCWTILQNPRMF